MKEIRPKITCKVDTTPKSFIDRMETVASELDDYEVSSKRHYSLFSQENNSYLRIKPTFPTPHEGLVIDLLATVESETRVSFKLEAKSWRYESPTYEIYVQTAHNVIRPLLAAYNRRHKTRRRLNVQSKEATEPKLPPKCKQHFEFFVRHANKGYLHPDDWRNFYLFVRFAHRVNLKLVDTDIQRLLWKAGFSEEEAAEIANVYMHCRELLKVKLYWYHFDWSE